jgi:hypothetical protein
VYLLITKAARITKKTAPQSATDNNSGIFTNDASATPTQKATQQ